MSGTGPATPAVAQPPAQKRINLALQGGGTHGAFTWGVLDHLLEDGRLDVQALSGASAGAMNAVNFAEGFRKGGAAGGNELEATAHEFESHCCSLLSQL